MAHRPAIDFFDDKWRWPAHKFDMTIKAITGDLYDQYNTYPAPLQDFQNFFSDVKELSWKANTKLEFQELMRARKNQRQRELRDAYDEVAVQLTANPELLPAPNWADAVCLFRHRTLGSQVDFFAGFLQEEPAISEEGRERRATDNHSQRKLSLAQEATLLLSPEPKPVCLQLDLTPGFENGTSRIDQIARRASNIRADIKAGTAKQKRSKRSKRSATHTTGCRPSTSAVPTAKAVRVTKTRAGLSRYSLRTL